MSATQGWLMSLATTSGFTKSGASLWRLLHSVVTHHGCLRLTPWMCIARIRPTRRMVVAIKSRCFASVRVLQRVAAPAFSGHCA